MKNQLLYTGELAKLFGVTEHTIRFYTKKGLIKPSATTEAGYHLYGFRAIRRLEQIISLRALDMPLEEIQSYLNHKNPMSYRNQLEKISNIITEKIKTLHTIQEKIDSNLLMTSKYNLHGREPFIDEVEERYLLPIMDVRSPYAYEIPLDIFYQTLMKQNLQEILEYSKNIVIYSSETQHKVCIIVSTEDMVFIDLSKCIQLPSCSYIHLFYPTADIDDYENRYKKLRNYILEENLTTRGWSVDLYASKYYIFHEEKESSLIQIPLLSQ